MSKPMCDTTNFGNTMLQVKAFIEKGETKAERMNLVDYCIYIFRNEYIAWTKSQIFWQRKDDVGNPFVAGYYDEIGEYHTFSGTGSKQTISLSASRTAVNAWNKDRMRDALAVVKAKKFKYDRHNHKAIYFPEIDLLAVYNGKHTISAGVYYDDGEIEAEIYDMSVLFPYITSLPMSPAS